MLGCPSCGALVHSDELKALAAAAEKSGAEGNLAVAAQHWREALALLPAGAGQRAAIEARLADLERKPDAPPKPVSFWSRAWAPFSAVGLLLLKFKGVLLGATKLTTLLTMLASIAVYWQLWGLPFAVGFVVMIYVHELGHVAALRERGIKASAPMFIPGLGAFVRLHEYPKNAVDDARVGLAGPLWGLAISIAAWGVSLATGNALFVGLARTSAWINLFNLVPIGSLDGGRGVRALSSLQRFALAAVMLGGWLVCHEGLLLVLAAVATWRAFEKSAPVERNDFVLAEFSFLVLALSALCLLPVARLH